MASLGSNQNSDLIHGTTNPDGTNTTGSEVQHNLLTSSIHSNTSFHSAVSWSAVLAGTAAAAALSLILIILGAGLGMSSLSVWSGQGISAMTLGITSIIWLALTQIIAYGMGGYLAGRLRTKWVSVHSDEVYFRDTAHGFLTWALTSLICATLLASVISSITGAASKAGASMIDVTTSAAVTGVAANMDNNAKNMSSTSNPMNYMIGTLFRKDQANFGTSTGTSNQGTDTNKSVTENNTNSDPSQQSDIEISGINQHNGANQKSEVMSIFINSMNAPTLPANDIRYVGQIVSQQTGLSQPEAEKRVETTFANMQEKKMKAIIAAKDTADKVRKTTAYTALWLFVFLLVGAFSASLAATWGGTCRDN